MLQCNWQVSLLLHCCVLSAVFPMSMLQTAAVAHVVACLLGQALCIATYAIHNICRGASLCSHISGATIQTVLCNLLTHQHLLHGPFMPRAWKCQEPLAHHQQTDGHSQPGSYSQFAWDAMLQMHVAADIFSARMASGHAAIT